MTVLIVPEAMAPDLRRYVANNGRIYTTHAGPAGAHSLRSFAGLRTTQRKLGRASILPERPKCKGFFEVPSRRMMRRLMGLRLTLKARNSLVNLL